MEKRAHVKTRGHIAEVGNTYPLGTGATIQCIKDIGQYIIDNADEIGKTAQECIGVRIEGQIWINSLPTVYVSFQKANTERLEELARAEVGK